MDKKDSFQHNSIEIIEASEMVRVVNDNGKDFAIIKLKTLPQAPPLKFIDIDPQIGASVYTLGHPDGLPLKYSHGGKVVSTERHSFTVSLDTFCGNSGSPVFLDRTETTLAGILIKGQKDWDILGGEAVPMIHKGGGETVFNIHEVMEIVKKIWITPKTKVTNLLSPPPFVSEKKLIPFPQYLHNIPGKAASSIVKFMDFKMDHDWRYLAMELWPYLTERDLDIASTNKMKFVIDKLGGEGKRSHFLLNKIKEIERLDVIQELESQGYDVSQYLPEK